MSLDAPFKWHSTDEGFGEPTECRKHFVKENVQTRGE